MGKKARFSAFFQFCARYIGSARGKSVQRGRSSSAWRTGLHRDFSIFELIFSKAIEQILNSKPFSSHLRHKIPHHNLNDFQLKFKAFHISLKNYTTKGAKLYQDPPKYVKLRLILAWLCPSSSALVVLFSNIFAL